jgi:hypothetical protein
MVMALPASYTVDKERRVEAHALRGRRRDKLLASGEAEGAGAEAGVDANAMAMASPASYAVDKERREVACVLRGRRRDEWQRNGDGGTATAEAAVSVATALALRQQC